MKRSSELHLVDSKLCMRASGKQAEIARGSRNMGGWLSYRRHTGELRAVIDPEIDF